MDLLIGTHNLGKLEEFVKLFKNYNIKLYTLNDFKNIIEPIESGSTFKENAYIKAKSYYEQTKMNVICDDTGLCVDSLNGEPGVYSARYACDIKDDFSPLDNSLKLLNKLKGITNRKAHFECSIVFFNGKEFIDSQGIINGTIANDFKGDSGFGYDPLFIPDGYDKTFAELGLDIKNKISHRALALNDILVKLDKILNK